MITLLFLRPVGNQRRAGHADPDGERSRRYVVLGHFLIEDGLVPGGFAKPAVFLGPGDGAPTTFVEGVLPLAAAAYVLRVRGVPGPVSQTCSDLGMLLEPRRHPAPERGVLLRVVKIHRCLHPYGLGEKKCLSRPTRIRASGRCYVRILYSKFSV